MRLSLLGLALLVGTVARAQPVGPPPVPEIHSKHFVYGYPTGTPITNDLVVRDAYALSSNDATRFADWVAFRLTPQEVFGVADAGDFLRAWERDPWLDADETLDPKPLDPYKGTDYQRGHLAPLAAFVGTEYVPEVNLYSNIAPQRADLNAGPWEEIEAAVRGLVLRRASRALRSRPAGHRGFPQSDDLAAVWVLTGPVYERPMPPLNTSAPHQVPSGFWKVVVVQQEWAPETVVAVAFFFDQDTPRSDDPLDHLVSVDEVEARSGLDLFRLLPEAVETVMEATVDRSAAESLLFPSD